MEKTDVQHTFDADGATYRMSVHLLSEKPLVFRHEFSRRTIEGEWEHVAYDDREYDDPENKGGHNPAILDLLRREAPLMANEFLNYLRKKPAKKRRKKKPEA